MSSLLSTFDPLLSRYRVPNVEASPKLPLGLEPRTSTLPRWRSTTELWQRRDLSIRRLLLVTLAPPGMVRRRDDDEAATLGVSHS